MDKSWTVGSILRARNPDTQADYGVVCMRPPGRFWESHVYLRGSTLAVPVLALGTTGLFVPTLISFNLSEFISQSRALALELAGLMAAHIAPPHFLGVPDPTKQDFSKQQAFRYLETLTAQKPSNGAAIKYIGRELIEQFNPRENMHYPDPLRFTHHLDPGMDHAAGYKRLRDSDKIPLAEEVREIVRQFYPGESFNFDIPPRKRVSSSLPRPDDRDLER